eukprot:GHRR01015855.1.p1 GENE.GHRR01015855.1~~GHRR01015855.1.p1  ORF type:complete len:113 (-),score=11.85 GHRR01015855.1:422-760(-)
MTSTCGSTRKKYQTPSAVQPAYHHNTVVMQLPWYAMPHKPIVAWRRILMNTCKTPNNTLGLWAYMAPPVFSCHNFAMVGGLNPSRRACSFFMRANSCRTYSRSLSGYDMTDQ